MADLASIVIKDLPRFLPGTDRLDFSSLRPHRPLKLQPRITIMASKVLLVLLALAVLTAFVAADEDANAFVDDLFEMAKRGKGRRRKPNKAFIKENLFKCPDMSGYMGCVCDKSAADPYDPVIC